MFARILRRRTTALPWKPTAGRCSSTAAGADSLRARIMGEIKTAMKNRDPFTSTTLRSVLSEVYNADKAAPEGKLNSEKIATILRKAFDRRSEAVSKFQAASREDLAEKEQKEMDIIAKFLPTLLSESDIDAILSPIVNDTPPNPPQKALGTVFKQFYAQVDRSKVDAELLKKRAQVLLASNS